MLLEEEDRARPGQAVNLLRPDGRPRWSRFEVGADSTPLRLVPGKPLGFEGLSMALLELLPPNPKRQRFRFTAEVRQTDHIFAGGVGLYVGRVSGQSPNGPRQVFVSVDLAELTLREQIGEPVPAPPEGALRVALALRSVHRPADSPPRTLRVPLGADAALRPVRQVAGKAPWRLLAVEMTPERLRLIGEVGPAGKVGAAQVETMARMLGVLDKGVGRLKLRPSPGGGVGVFVLGGAMEVRQARIEPLPERP
jgi:hypothetical protein